MKTYISGKIAGINKANAEINFNFASREAKKYHGANETVNPFDIKPFLGVKCWLCYMINDIREQRKCEASAFQPNWIKSRGAVIEYYFARFIFKQKIIFLGE